MVVRISILDSAAVFEVIDGSIEVVVVARVVDSSCVLSALGLV